MRKDVAEQFLHEMKERNRKLAIRDRIILEIISLPRLLLALLNLGYAVIVFIDTLYCVALFKLQKRQKEDMRRKPPINGTFLLYCFMEANQADAIVGDIEERYPRMRKKFGGRRADFWVWSQTLRSLGPILWAWGKKATGLTALYEMWVKLRS